MPVTQHAHPGVPQGYDATQVSVAPLGYDVARPSVARIQDYLLFGKDHFAVDRAVADELAAARTDPQRLALASRDFLRRAVRMLADRGVTQFLDLGCGLPTTTNTHDVARAAHPCARVAYVDNDPLVTGHVAARLATPDGVRAVRADIRAPESLLGTLIASGAFDPARPAAVLLVSVLDFITDAEDPPAIVAAIRDRLAPGSYLVLSAATCDGARKDQAVAATAAWSAAGVPFTLRSCAQFTRLFDGFELLEPGVVSLPDWRPLPWTDRTPLQSPTLCGVGRLGGRP
jgi:SAM-dependent methyltransferase